MSLKTQLRRCTTDCQSVAGLMAARKLKYLDNARFLRESHEAALPPVHIEASDRF
jgi:hypothetical protein